MPNSVGNRRIFWYVLATVVAVDFVTKAIAVAKLTRFPIPVVGDWVTLQLVYNTGAAFGIHIGPQSRLVFGVLAVVALVVLGAMMVQTPPVEKLRLFSLGLVCGGAVGNLVDRVRSARGVVDFIDVGVGAYRWPTFNVADVAVSCGAVTLAVILWNDDSHGVSDTARAAR